MEGNRQPYFRKLDSPQFKKKGGNQNRKGQNSSREQPFGNSNATDTVYRILCHSRKIGSVIGKGGSIVKALREDTQAKITVAEPVPGSDERVVLIYSPSKKIPKGQDNDDENPTTENEDAILEPHCPAQDALLKVHDRIIEEELVGGMEDDNENTVIARLLVPNNMVGCILGKKGDVIQRLRSETGASIRVLPENQIPSCAMGTDELVQISGKPKVAKRALYEVSTLLHQNPRKDNAPLNIPTPYGGQGFHPHGPPMPTLHPPENPMWSHRRSDPRDMPMPWMGGYGNPRSEFGRGGFDDVHDAHGDEAPSEFSLKILCTAGRIGGVIGKGGSNVKQLQQETGASIHVEDASTESEERVIRVSSLEAPWNPRSQTIEAILQLQNKTSELSEKGITTRLLVPSSKVGCILGQGGHVINEMRRRTQADIRVYSKEEKPKCAADDEELVQISGNFGVAKDALAEIASRLRARCLRDTNPRMEPPPIGKGPEYGPPGNLAGGRPRPSGPMRPGSFSAFGHAKGGGHDYETPSYRAPPRNAGYPNVDASMEMKIPYNSVGSVAGTGRSNIDEFAGTRARYQDPQAYGSERFADTRRSSDHLNATQNIHRNYSDSSDQSNFYPPQGSYQGVKAPQSAYEYPNPNTSHAAYQNTYQASYQGMGSEQAPYQSIGGQGSYQY